MAAESHAILLACRVLAVSDVGFQVRRGEAVGLIGQSGSGKRTIARLLLRLERWDRGTVSLDGKPVAAADRALELRRRIQLIFQDPFASLNPVHDVEHHIARPLLRHGLATPTSVRRQASELLSRVGLDPPGEFLSRMPAELSGGQRQRVAIARALVTEPALILADEPTANLDAANSHNILKSMVQLNKELGTTFIFATHDDKVIGYLKRKISLVDGKVTTDEIRNN